MERGRDLMTTLSPRKLLGATFAGGLGGLVNAALCYANWPVVVVWGQGYVDGTPIGQPLLHPHFFRWHVVPAGFAHGAILAGVGAATAMAAPRWKPLVRWAAVVVVWLVAQFSWVP